MRDLMHIEKVGKFTVAFYAMPEDFSPRGQFTTEDGQDDEEVLSRIESGDYLWFQVECVAMAEGVDLGHDYLGGCCYESYEDFIKANDYAADMREAALAEARAKVAKLARYKFRPGRRPRRIKP